jgi:hypothetical protein
MTAHDRAINHVRLQLAAVLVLRQSLALLTAWVFIWGAAVLGLRAAFAVERPPLLWGLAAVPLAVLAAYLLARRHVPARTAFRALLDRQSGCGGLLMAAEEQPLGGWEQRMPAPVRPELHWQARRSWALLGIGTAFVLLCFAIPQRYTNLGGQPLEIGPEVAKLKEQVKFLKEEAILEPERAEALDKKLDQVRDEASGKNPVKTLEALDHVQDVASKAGKQAAEQAGRKKESAVEAKAAAELLRKKGKQLTPKQLAGAMAELATLTRKAAAENALANKGLNSKKLKAALEGKIDVDELKDLLAALDASEKDVDEFLGKLKILGMIDEECMCKCKGKCWDDKDLEVFLSKHPKLAECEGGRPGVGGITRGPGPAQLGLTNNTPEEELKLKAQALPPRALEVKKSQLRGLSKTAPEVSKPGTTSDSGALTGAAADGGSANTQVVLPRHRGTVSRYFERTPK